MAVEIVWRRLELPCNLTNSEQIIALFCNLWFKYPNYFNQVSGGETLITLRSAICGFALLAIFLSASVPAASSEKEPTTEASPSPNGLSGAGSAQPPAPPANQSFTDPYSGIEFVFVKGGEFEMGDVFGDGHSDELPVHKVLIKDFYIGKFEVTQTQWEKVMGFNPSEFKGENLPVDSVSWLDAREFIAKLNENSKSGPRVRLPSEAEWEYAARSGGKKEKWAGTTDKNMLFAFGWMNLNSEGKTQPVGFRMPNGLGLHDMSGNVLEWCRDWYLRSSYSMEKKDDSEPPYPDIDRVTRGGACAHPAEELRTSFRSSFPPDYLSRYIGLRLAADMR